MRPYFILGAAAAASLLCANAWAASDAPAPVAAAVADSHRPAEDTARDAARKPAEMLTFAGVKAGDTVLEILPGGGYFTRLLSKTVGPKGHVYAAVPDPKGKFAEPAAAAIAADPAYGNVSVIEITAMATSHLPPRDLIRLSQNYHDLHLSEIHTDVSAVDKAWFGMLKPGGTLLIIDHAALPGSPVGPTADKLHRIDPAVVRQEVEGAGFRFDGQSDAVRNPADPHTAIVFDPSIRGKTDQFAFRFRKP
ncbi:MAG: class I SAM-dependent methyltransferase [Caulobacteraceae bacterium]